MKSRPHDRRVWRWLLSVAWVGCILASGSAPAQGLAPLPGFVSCSIPLSSGGAAAPEPIAIAAGSFDGTGVPDLAIVDGANNQVIVLLTNRPRFQRGDCLGATTASTVAVSSGPTAIASGDLDNNGTIDLVVAVQAGVSILRGSGSGTFTPEAPISAGPDPRAVAIADVDGDGRPDIVVGSGFGNSVTVLYGRSGGGFDTGGSIAVDGPVAFMVVRDFPPPGNPRKFPPGSDFNHDGFLDIAVGSNVSGKVSLLLQQRSAPRTFRPVTSFAAGVAPTAMAADYFDIATSGALDLATTSGGASGKFSVFLNTILPDGGVSFAPAPQPLPTPVLANPSALAADDFNSDGNPDLAVANQGDDTVTFLLGDGNAAMTEVSDACGLPGADLAPCITSGGPVTMVLADVDGDGFNDVITANQNPGSISVLLSSRPQATPTATATATFTFSATPTVTATVTPTPTNTPTSTPTPTPTPTNTGRPTFTFTITPTPTVQCVAGVCIQGTGCDVESGTQPAPRFAWWLLPPAIIWILRRPR